MDNVRIREFEPSDYATLFLIRDSLFPNNRMFPKRVEYEDSCYGRTRYRMKRFVAETGTGEVVGFGEYKHLFFSYHPRKFAVDVAVHPRWQRRGIGGALYHRVMTELTGVGAETARPLVLSTSKSAIRFLRRRGFVEESRTIESVLGLETFETKEFAKMVGRLEDEGIVIASFSDEMRLDSSAGRKFKDLEESGAADVPHAITDYPMDFHDYEIVILNSPIIIWEGSFVATERDVYLGSSSLLESGIDDVVDQGFTVVRPGYRGRGIARAVKFRTAMYAKGRGARYIRTYNDSENIPMLAVNRKMGFAERAEWITFEKNL